MENAAIGGVDRRDFFKARESVGRGGVAFVSIAHFVEEVKAFGRFDLGELKGFLVGADREGDLALFDVDAADHFVAIGFAVSEADARLKSVDGLGKKAHSLVSDAEFEVRIAFFSGGFLGGLLELLDLFDDAGARAFRDISGLAECGV